MLRVAVLVSGSGSNLQSVIDSSGENYKVEMVIGSKDGIFALERAKNHDIQTFVARKSEDILNLVQDKVDLIVLAGFLSILDGEILKKFKNKIINIHPSLIPSFCGHKMYGMNVHNAVKKSGVKITGATVHFVNEEVDGGAIILQESVPVSFDDEAIDIQKRVLGKEHILLPKAIELIALGKIDIIDGLTYIRD